MSSEGLCHTSGGSDGIQRCVGSWAVVVNTTANTGGGVGVEEMILSLGGYY